ncbi:unnamed protein product [Rotaria sordida]|uniref:USP domain-containing protein n=1 Tax=Rotaria sordida TaxID=392033 RepID=A0A813TFT0_9BILA|nr:unnamed protein product [Rotaria sordida]CAF0807669.1 unnamed protein product [Rotaria sordida]
MGTRFSTRNLIQYTQSLMTFICGSICLLLLSILTYVTLRKHLLPTSHLIMPMSLGLPPSFNLKDDLIFLKSSTNFPSYLVSYINLSDTIYDQYPLDISSHSYRVELHCYSPRSYRNRQLGSFFVQLILNSTSHQLIIEHSRLILFPYQSDIIRLIRTFLFLPLSIFRIDYDRWHLKEILIERLNNQEKSKRFIEIIQLNIIPSTFQLDQCSIHFDIRDLTGLIINVKMNQHKCKGYLIDSTHGKLQKKKDALLEFIFAENALCLTVSAQNVNIITYTLNNNTISKVILSSALLAINLIDKKQIKISGIGKNKLSELKNILDCLLHEDYTAYQTLVENFCNNSFNSNNISRNELSKINQSTHSIHNDSSLLSDITSKKQPKIDKMKHTNQFLENDENSQPTMLNTSKTIEKKKNTLLSASNFYPHSQDDHHHNSIDENIDHTTQVQQQSRKRTSENQFSTSSIRFQHATNTTSPYFSHKTDYKIKRNTSNGESRISLLSNIYSKPLNNNTRFRNNDDDDNEEYLYNCHDSPYTTKKLDNQSSTDISLSKAVTTTMNLRKKGLKNIGATCYMNSILQCLLNIDPFRYDLMVTNSELITSSLLEENTIYLCVLKILALLQDRQSTQSQHSTTTQLTDDERTVESQALINLKKA